MTTSQHQAIGIIQYTVTGRKCNFKTNRKLDNFLTLI